MSYFGVPLIAVKQCPICGNIKTYDPREHKSPVGWIHLMALGVDDTFCSNDCYNAALRVGRERTKAFEESRKEPLLPPDVVI